MDRVAVDPPPGGRITLVCDARKGIRAAPETEVGVLLTQFTGNVEELFVEKLVHDDATIHRVSIGGSMGYRVPGPHTIEFINARGIFDSDSARLAANTLI